MIGRFLSRRAAVRLAIGGGAALAAPALARTPRQTAGPFYPGAGERLADTDRNLVRVEGRVREAGGEVMRLSGRVLERERPVHGARVEIWQCDAKGTYLDQGAPGRDLDFQGFGRVTTGADGGYAFRTIKPVPYSGRAPHIHVLIRRPDGREALTTQFYLAGHPLNAQDGLWRRLSAAERAAVAMSPSPGEGGDLAAEMEIRLG